MKHLTLFRAYRAAESHKYFAVLDRQGSKWGIAVENDKHALIWQRYSRLSERIIARFEGIKVCPICVRDNGDHWSDCRYYKQFDN